MIDFIQLLNGATAPISISSECHVLAKQSSPYWEAVEKAFSTRFVNEMFCALCNENAQECKEHFERGLWLGLKLGQLTEQGPRGGVGDG